MDLLHTSTTRPVTIVSAVLLLTIFGVLALLRVPVQLKPTIDQPVISVNTTFRGAAPQEVEQQVTDAIEEKLNSVENVKKITSTSQEGRSSISLQFEWGVNKDLASIDILKKLNLVDDLPDDADEPIISAISSDEAQPIMWVIIKGAMPVNQVRKFGDDLIAPRLKRVAGVGNLWVFGGQKREIHVVLDHRALNARGLSISQVRRALNDENRNVRGGHIDEGKRRWAVRTVGQFTAVEQIGAVIIAKNGGVPVYVRDVAQVVDSFEERQAIIKEHGVPTVGFGIIKKTGTNTLTVIEGVRAAIAGLNRVLVPKGLRLQPVYDETIYIRDAIALVTQNLRFGAFLAVIVLLFFLHSLRSTLIIGFSIPISLVGTFIVVLAFGRSLNIISLAGLAFAVGMVVDNAIVVLENIYRHLQMGKTRLAAAYDGGSEVWGAVLASTLTTLAVFVPIIFIEEEVGQLFKDLALAISSAVGLSLLVSITVIPMLCARYLRVSASKKQGGGASPSQLPSQSPSQLPSQSPRRAPRLAGARLLIDLALLGWLGRWVFRLIVATVRWLIAPVRLSPSASVLLPVLTAADIAAGTLLAQSFGGGLSWYAWGALSALSYLLLDTAMRLAQPGVTPLGAGDANGAPPRLAGVVFLAALLGVLLLPLVIHPVGDGFRFIWEQTPAASSVKFQGGFGPPRAGAAQTLPGAWTAMVPWLLFIMPTLAAGLLTFSGVGISRLIGLLRIRTQPSETPGAAPNSGPGAEVKRAAGDASPSPTRTAPSFTALLQKVALIVLVTVGFLASLQVLPKAEYLPGGNRNFIFVILKPYAGTNLEKLEELTDRLQDKVLDLPEINYLFAVAGQRFKGLGIIAKREYEPQLKQLVGKIQRILAGAPGFQFALALQSNIFTRQFGKSFDIEVRGKDLDEVAALAERIKGQLMPRRGPRGSAPALKRGPQREPAQKGSGEARTVSGVERPDGVRRDGLKPATFDGRAGRSRDGIHTLDTVPAGAARDVSAGDGAPRRGPATRRSRRGDASRGIAGVTFVRSSYETGNPELQVQVDRERAADLGLSVRDVADVVETLVAGQVATEYKEGGEKIDVRVRGAHGVYRDTSALNDLIIYTPPGMQVKLTDIAQIIKTTGPTKIDHIELDRSVKLTVNVARTAPLGQVIDAVTQQVINPLLADLPPGYSINLAGSADKLKVAITEVTWSLAFAVIIVFLLMASLFESFFYPLIILFSVPLAVIGAILAVRITHAEYTMITRLGFILLSGIVVNTAILLVHQTLNFIRNDGMEAHHALLESVRTRIRPIFMSTITSVLGMLPLAAGNEFGIIATRIAGALHIERLVGAAGLLPESTSSAGAELYRGLGAAVVGGLTVSSLLTLILVPVFFAFFLDVRGLISRFTWGRGKPAVMVDASASTLPGIPS